MHAMQIGPYTVEITHPERVLFPEDGISKWDLAAYYRDVGEVMLPHVFGRPVSMQRFPDGIGEPGFYHKEIPDYYPEWIARATVPKKEGGSITQVVCENPATLAYLANQGCITPHVFLSRADRLDYPDRLIFDLDPPDDNFALAIHAAKELRERLSVLGLTPFVMTTGSRGLHVTVPLDRAADFDTARAFARQVAEAMVADDPARYTIEPHISERGNRLFLDTLRNSYAATAVPPYAVRARPGAPVATPLGWDELGRRSLTARYYTLRNVLKRLDRQGDPWAEIDRHAGSIAQTRERL